MKIYIDNICNISDNDISKYIISNSYTNYIFSDNGIYKISNNNLNKVNIIDKDIIKGSFNNKINYTIDNSVFEIQKKTIYNLPINHILIKINKIKYKFCENDIFIVIENYNNIKNIYFQVNDSINNIKLYENDIITFLSNNNLY
jgi:hypothetical protein